MLKTVSGSPGINAGRGLKRDKLSPVAAVGKVRPALTPGVDCHASLAMTVCWVPRYKMS